VKHTRTWAYAMYTLCDDRPYRGPTIMTIISQRFIQYLYLVTNDENELTYNNKTKNRLVRY